MPARPPPPSKERISHDRFPVVDRAPTGYLWREPPHARARQELNLKAHRKNTDIHVLYLYICWRVGFSGPRVTELLDLIACFVSVVTLYKQKQYGTWGYRTGHNQLPPASVCM